MIRINLLPPEIGRRRKIKQIAIMFGMLSIMYIGLLAVVFVLLTGRVAMTKRELGVAQAEVQTYSARLAQVADLQKEIKSLEDKLNFRAKVVEANNTWVVVLDIVRQYVPRDVWITAIDITPPDTVVLNCSTLGGPKSLATCNLSFMNCKDIKDAVIDQTSFSVPRSGQTGGAQTAAAAQPNQTAAAPGALQFKVSFKLLKPVGLEQPAAAPEAAPDMAEMPPSDEPEP